MVFFASRAILCSGGGATLCLGRDSFAVAVAALSDGVVHRAIGVEPCGEAMRFFMARDGMQYEPSGYTVDLDGYHAPHRTTLEAEDLGIGSPGGRSTCLLKNNYKG